MGIFNREKFVLVNIETKETVFEYKDFVAKETVLEEIEKENISPGLYRLECWGGSRKIRNEWVMRKPKKKPTPEEVAAKGQEEAEEFMLADALDIKARVEKHNAFKAKVREMYGIEGGSSVDNIAVPTGKDGKLTIMGAANQAIAESTYLGIRETKPAEVAEAVKSIMNSGTTILAGIAEMLTNRIVDSKKRPHKKVELENKKELEKKSEPKKEEVKTHKEDLGKGKTKTTFGPDASTDPSYQHQKLDTTFNGSNTPNLPVTYEEYEKDMLGDEGEEESETE